MRFSLPALTLLTACAAELDYRVDSVVDRPLVRVVHTNQDGTVLSCVDPTDPEDGPLVQAAGPRSFHVVGMHADRLHGCTLTGHRRSVDLEIQTEPLPTGLGEVRAEWTERPEHYTAINLWSRDGDLDGKQHLVVLDPDGEIVAWVPLGDAAPAIDIAQNGHGQLVVGGGPQLEPRWLDALGMPTQILGEAPIPGGYHHHAQPLSDGSVLALTYEDNATESAPDDPWEGFAIQQIAPDGAATWSWRSADHLDALPSRTPGVRDPWHPNSVSFVDDAHGPAAWQSLAWLGQVVRIDRNSGAITDVLGPNGTLDLQTGTWPHITHDPEWDGDRVLVYDNGPNGGSSRAVEYAIDLDARTATQLWEWTEPGWSEPLFGDVDRTADDRVLIARGRCWADRGCDGFDVDPDRVASLVEIDTTTGDVVWRVDWPTTTHSFYRAERVDRCALLGGCPP